MYGFTGNDASLYQYPSIPVAKHPLPLKESQCTPPPRENCTVAGLVRPQCLANLLGSGQLITTSVEGERARGSFLDFLLASCITTSALDLPLHQHLRPYEYNYLSSVLCSLWIESCTTAALDEGVRPGRPLLGRI
ncbi:hypothetical protein HGRIS_002878 [Hohenbuehelia grisea]|uniref:Uncharacterized protein n=1 Tax=Hohenbuehelia grisea TaxID=104357 RepID=A0ABR3JLU3_9AGAR